MEPSEIAQLITEDIHFNNGLDVLMEAETLTGAEKKELITKWETNDPEFGDIIQFNIPANQLAKPIDYPKLGVATSGAMVTMPTFFRTKVDINNLYTMLTNFAQQQGGLKGQGRNGWLYMGKETQPYNLCRNREASEVGIIVTHLPNREGHLQNFSTLLRLVQVRQQRGTASKFDPEEWDTAVRNRMGTLDLADHTPPAFEGYYAVENKAAQTVLMIAGKMGMGLYCLPMKIQMGDQQMNWVDAISLFAENPMQYLQNLNLPEAELAKITGKATLVGDRIRLLWRYFMEGTKQGRYIDRVPLNPEKIIEIFAAAPTPEAFFNTYKQAVREALERLKTTI